MITISWLLRQLSYYDYTYLNILADFLSWYGGRKEEGGRRWVQMNISIEIVLYYSILIKFNTMEIERKEFAIHSEAQSLVNKSFRRVRGAGAISHVYQLRTCWLTQTEKALLLAISHQCSGESRNIKGNRSKLRKQ